MNACRGTEKERSGGVEEENKWIEEGEYDLRKERALQQAGFKMLDRAQTEIWNTNVPKQALSTTFQSLDSGAGPRFG